MSCRQTNYISNVTNIEENNGTKIRFSRPKCDTCDLLCHAETCQKLSQLKYDALTRDNEDVASEAQAMVL